MNLTKLITTILALSLTLSAGTALSQEKQETIKGNLEQAEQNIDSVGKNLKDAGKAAEEGLANTAAAAEEGLANTAEAAEQGLANATEAIETKSNWGWLGLLGLLGLFGLLGKNKKTTVIEEDNNVEYLQS